MDRKTYGMPIVTVNKGSQMWAYTDHKAHWCLVAQNPETVVIRHCAKGEPIQIDAPDSVLMLEPDANGWHHIVDITGGESP